MPSYYDVKSIPYLAFYDKKGRLIRGVERSMSMAQIIKQFKKINGRIFIHLHHVVKAKFIQFFLAFFIAFIFTCANAQETPATSKVIFKDSTRDLKRTPFIERMADRYTSDSIEPNKKGLVVRPGATLGIGYRIRTTKHGQVPYGSQHSITANYGINRGAIFIEYLSNFNQVIGNWDLNTNARADIINVINFYGIGNETLRLADDDDYQLKSREWLGALGLSRQMGIHHILEFRSYFQSIRINSDNHQFIQNLLTATKEDYARNNFLGFSAGYQYQKKNDLIHPTKGIELGTLAAYNINLHSSQSGFSRFTSYISHYLPLSAQFTLANRLGSANIIGSPEFYQLNILGGNENLRGFRRQRFYGKSTLFLNNEIRWLVPTNKKFFSKVGLLAFADAGRVWQQGEKSNLIHFGYGGGLLIIPFNRIVVNGSYGFSKEDRVMHLRIGYLF